MQYNKVNDRLNLLYHLSLYTEILYRESVEISSCVIDTSVIQFALCSASEHQDWHIINHVQNQRGRSHSLPANKGFGTQCVNRFTVCLGDFEKYILNSI